ncbi:MAG TPA: hypothetical protein PLR01_11955, partial [Bacteroidales bacterium]|nr:hypothetical protein [Bacteroidales bacterium]
MRNLLKISSIAITALLMFAFCDPPMPGEKYKSDGRIPFRISFQDEQMLDSIQQKTFLFFLHEHHPDWGVVKDRTAEWAPASIAATGFGLPCFAI